MYVVAHNGSRILGGGELAALRLLAGLQARGHRVLMLMRDREMAARAADYGVPASVQHVGGAVSAHDALRLAARLRREKPDAVLLTSFAKLPLAGLGARLAGVPRIVQRVGLETDTPARGVRYRWALRHLVDAVVVNAEEMRGAFRSAGPARVLAIPQGVRTPCRLRPHGALRRELGISADAPVVGAVARLARQKRLDRLVRALPQLPPDVHCVVAGEGDERQALCSLAAELGVAHRLHLPGFQREVGDVLDALDLFVVCSDREGMAGAMLEAMACGVPVLSTRVSGADEALRPFADGVAPGQVVGFGDDEIAGALRRLLGDAAARRAMGAAGRRRVAESFAFETMIDRWEHLLCGGVAAARPPLRAALGGD